MPKFIYVGEYPANGDPAIAYERPFCPGVGVDLPEPLATKARNNKYFVPDDGHKAPTHEPVRQAAPAPAPKPEPKPEPTPPPKEPVHELTKADLIDMAEQAGVEIDKRWSVEKIKQAIKDADDGLHRGKPNA